MKTEVSSSERTCQKLNIWQIFGSESKPSGSDLGLRCLSRVLWRYLSYMQSSFMLPWLFSARVQFKLHANVCVIRLWKSFDLVGYEHEHMLHFSNQCLQNCSPVENFNLLSALNVCSSAHLSGTWGQWGVNVCSFPPPPTPWSENEGHNLIWGSLPPHSLSEKWYRTDERASPYKNFKSPFPWCLSSLTPGCNHFSNHFLNHWW